MNRKHLYTAIVAGLLTSGGLAMAVPGPAIATCPPRTTGTGPRGTGPRTPCITTTTTRAPSTTSTTTTEPEATTTTTTVIVDPPRQLPDPPEPVVVVPRFTG